MIRWLGLAAAGIALLVSPPLARLGSGQAPADSVPSAATPPWAALPPAANPALAGPPSAAAGSAPLGTATQVPGGGLPLAAGGGATVGGASAGEMIGFSRPAADGGQLLTLIDTARQWMAVYHIEGSGRIRLIGSRPLSQDFAVQYNAVAPLPAEMRQLGGG